jgi:hypothetical protein
MSEQLVKISLIAEELGVSVKTIYNWITLGKLDMPRAGFVSRIDAYEVWLKQKDLRKIHSYFLSINITRGTDGRFLSDG